MRKLRLRLRQLRKCRLMPHSAPTPLLHSAFYRFTRLADPGSAAATLRLLGQQQGILGSIVVAAEGVSGAVAGTAADVSGFELALQQPAFLSGRLAGIAFRRSSCVTAPFGRLKVGVKPEIVALGGPRHPGSDAHPDARPARDPANIRWPAPHGPGRADDRQLDATAWRALLARDDLVLLDNRNHFEYRLGHFQAAADPQVNNFRDFRAFVEQRAPAWRAAGRPVAMYCTGGIRCEKTAPWLSGLGLQVWQLQGGILNYFQQTDGAAHGWVGECFVFDRRIALNTNLQETSTTAAQVYDARQPDEAWRLQRARQLDAFERNLGRMQALASAAVERPLQT